MFPRMRVFLLLAFSAGLLIGCNNTFTAVTASMEPTVPQGTSFELAPVPAQVSRGIVVVFKDVPDVEGLVVGRVMAIGGDTLAIDAKVVTVNGTVLSEPYVVHRDRRVVAPDYASGGLLQLRDHLPEIEVPEGHVFFLGDNRDLSYDSRFVGTMPVANIYAIARLDP